MKTSARHRMLCENEPDSLIDAPLVPSLDRPMTLRDAAVALGVPYHVVQRAACRGLVPTYRLGTSRPYVKLRDFFDLMERSANR
jgi:hypothetical protein